jgi:anti-sigma regulatory factor (Ser/Thr protein kinase)
MPTTDGSSNGRVPPAAAIRLSRSRAGAQADRGGERYVPIESLTVAVGRLRRGAAALKIENRELRAELAGLDRSASGRRGGDAPVHELARLAEIVLPAGVRAPGAARMVVAHCLSALVTQRILRDAELLVSELVTNSIDHGQLDNGDSVLLRIFLATESLRLEIENSGTAGVVAANRTGRESGQGGYGLDLVELLAARWGVSRNRSTSVWFEMARV